MNNNKIAVLDGDNKAIILNLWTLSNEQIASYLGVGVFWIEQARKHQAALGVTV